MFIGWEGILRFVFFGGEKVKKFSLLFFLFYGFIKGGRDFFLVMDEECNFWFLLYKGKFGFFFEKVRCWVGVVVVLEEDFGEFVGLMVDEGVGEKRLV